MLRKFVTILTILAISLSAILPVELFAAADISYEGRICRDLGILKGDTGVVDNDYLQTRPTRLQAAIMYLRLKGLEQEALDYIGGNNFKDAYSIAWREGRNVLSYLKDHPELGWIGDGVNFLPYNLIDSKAYYKVLLESLGYKQKIDGEGDFDWNSVLEFAASKGLKKVANERYFTVECLAIATVEALNTKMKNTGMKLIDYLVEIGAVDRDAARDLDMYSEDIDAEIKYVRAISNSKVEVVFTEPVGSGAADEDLYDISQLDILRAAMKNDSAVIIDTTAMKENTTYTLVFDGRSYSFKGLKKDTYAPRLISAECRDTNLVELTFDRVLDNVTAQDPDIYTIEDAHVKYAELDSTNTKVRLTTSGVESGRSYELKVRGIKNGDGVAAKSITKKFSGRKDTSAPKLTKLTVLNNVKLLLEFSDSNGLDKSVAQDVDNYRITSRDGDLEVEAAKVLDMDEDGYWETVELLVETMQSGREYTLIIKEIADDSVLNNRSTREIKRDFKGKSADKSGPSVARNPVAVTNTMVEIQFSDSNALDLESACDTSNYEIDGLDVLDARIKDPRNLYSDAGRTVLLTTSEMEKSETYYLWIYGVMDEFGNELKSSSSKKYKFKGVGEDRTPPYITFVECLDNRTIELRFDNLLDEASAENIINYRIDGLALATKAVLQEDGKTVRLTVSSLSSDKNHTVTMNNIKDLSGNALSNVTVSILYNGSLYDDDPPEVVDIDAMNEREVWVQFDEAVYAEKAKMKASGINFEQVGSILDEGTTIVMRASASMEDEEYEVTSLTGVWDLRNNAYVLERGLSFYGTDRENDPPEVDDWDQIDARTFRVEFSEPVLLIKGKEVSGIKNPSGVNIEWAAVLNPDDEDSEEAYSTVDYIALNKNIPADMEFKFNFTAMVTDYAGLGAWDEDDDDYGDSGSTILESYIEDDEEPYIDYVEALNSKHVLIEFSEAIREPGRYEITYWDDKEREIDILLTEVDSKDKTKVNIYTEDAMTDEFYYTLKPVSAAVDIAGNKLDIKGLEFDFEGSNIMSSDYIQGVEVLSSNTLRVNKSTTILKVSSLYELAESGGTTGGNLISSTSRVNDYVHKVVSKKPLLREVKYKITVDGIEYSFKGSVPDGNLKLNPSDRKITYDNMDMNDHNIRVFRADGDELEVYKDDGCFRISSKEQLSNGEILYIYVEDEDEITIYGIRKKLEGVEQLSSSKDITSFVLKGRGYEVTGRIDEKNDTIYLTVPYGADLKNAVATFTCSRGAVVKVNGVVQKSGETPNDFTKEVTYTVIAQDGSRKDYWVNVSREESKYEKKITSFVFEELKPAVVGEINHRSHEITLTVPHGTVLKALKPTIKTSPDTRVSPASGERNDFRRPAVYKVIAKDGSVQEYTVIVKVAEKLSSDNRITYFAFPGYGPAAEADVKEDQRLIELKVPYGTDRSKLVAAFRVSPNAVVKVLDKVQQSGVTENDFTEDVKYTVIAEDGSIREYKVRVAVAPNTEKQFKQFGFAAPMVTGIIDEAAKQISVKVPHGTALNGLKAVFVTSKRSKVYVGRVEQKSGETVQDFTNPVIYTVVAQDGSRQNYTVTVTVEALSGPMITSFAFNGFKPPAVGVIDHINRIIRITVPKNTTLKNLVATFEFQGKSVEAKGASATEWMPQVSGFTAVDFRREAKYRVTPHEGLPVEYTVIVTLSEDNNWIRRRW